MNKLRSLSLNCVRPSKVATHMLEQLVLAFMHGYAQLPPLLNPR